MSAEPFIRAENASKTFEQGGVCVEALVRASCVVQRGDRIALVGASGSGKSTLLHLLGGLDRPTSGTIVWPALGDERSLRPLHISFVFQTPSLLPPLSAVENVELPLLLAGADAKAARHAAQRSLERFDLGVLARKMPDDLSAGQAQRVAMARALAVEPSVILADEPTGQLDHAAARHLFDTLLACLEGGEAALVVATHDAEVSQRMSERWDIHHGILTGG